jgi:hypothetical protein
MRIRPAHALCSAALALALAGMACAGGAAAPTSAPTRAPQPTKVVAAATNTPQKTTAPTAAPTQAPTAAPADTATTAATEAAPTQAPPTKTPLSGKLDLHGVSAYLDGSQYYQVVGLLTNGTDKPVSNVQLSLKIADSGGKTVLKDDSGNPTSTVTVNPILGTIDTGESTPFEYELSADGLDTSGWKFDIKLDSSETPSDFQRVPVEIANALTTVRSDGEVYLTGELVNKSDKPASIDNFAGAIVDGSGIVLGASRFQDVTRLLSPAGAASGTDRTPFVVHISGPVKPGGTANYYVDATENTSGDIQTAADVQLKLETTFVDADNDVHVIATVTNSGTNTMTVQVVAGLYDQSGKVLDGSSGSAPIDLAPGDSAPVSLGYFANLNGNGDLINQVVSTTAQIDPFWTFPVNSEFVALKASNVTTAVDSGSVTVKGDVVNTTTKALDRARVVVVIHDAAGKLIAADWASAAPDSGTIAPKAKQAWSVTIALPNKIDATTLKYDTIVQGYPKQ